VAALAFGLLPAWQMTRGDAAAHLKDHSRGAVGSVREMRSGRWLVSVQLALSLPLLVGAGLLVRTVYNLQNPDLGFRAERLLLARVNLGEIVQDVTRRDNLLREMRTRLERIPGVESASFSMLGLLSSAMSTATIDVEGSALTGERGRDSALDRVGAGYFTTLGIPLRIGRDIADTDRLDSPRVTVVNEAFVERHFSGRHPLGLRVTTIDDNDVRVPYEVVGVVADAHTHALRGEVEPRFFVPAEQRPSLGTTRTFLIRTFSSPAPLIPAVREALDEIDPGISVTAVSSTEDQIAVLTAEERTIARLASIFGVVALTLAAIGLYGVLSSGIARRASEIAIRIALGARPRRVVSMILRESFALVVAGLAAGGALAYVGSSLIANRLYGVAPDDPVTLATATAVLIVVALSAAYLPARRASCVDPIAVLHQN
jgi:predicted permease